MVIKIKSGTWKSVTTLKVRKYSAWKDVSAAYVRLTVGATKYWKQFFNGTATPTVEFKSSISQTTDATTWLVSLTGRYYHWTDADTLAYKFQKSTNSGVTWTTLPSGSGSGISNPSTGSSNSSLVYVLADDLSDVTPNIQNIYRFVVTGTNTTFSTSYESTDNTTSVYGPEDITITTTGKSYNSVDLDWTSTAAPNAQKYLVYYKVSSNSSYTFSKVIANTSTTVGSLSSAVEYNFKVVPITGVSNTYKGYRGNNSNVLTVTTNTAPAPTQVSSPTISGTSPSGQYGTTLTATAGSYTNASSVTTSLVAYSAPYTAPTNAETSSGASSNFSSTSHVIDQNDATTPARVFYTRDTVLGINGTTYYYYSASSITAYVGTVSDNFNRTTSGGLGTSSSGYIYSSAGSGTWSTNGSVASTSTGVNFYSLSYNYPLQTVELTGKTNLNASVKIPSGGGGPGLAFWVTSQGSWWAVAPSYYSATATVEACDGTSITTDNNGTGCGGCTTSYVDSTTYACAGSNTYPNCSNGSYTCSTTTTPGAIACTGSVSGMSSCPSTGRQAGQRCSGCTSSVSSTTCNGAIAEYSNGTLGTACGDRCSCTGPFSRAAYGCTGVRVYENFTICNNATLTTTYNASTVGYRCGACVAAPGPSIIAAVVAAQSSTYYVCTVSTCPTVYSYSINEEGAETNSCTPSSTTTRTYSCNPKTSSSVTTYYSRLRILSTSGSPAYSVVENADTDIASSISAYNKIYSISVATSGDLITAKGYNVSGTQIGNNVTYTRNSSDLVKTTTDGSSSAGIIYTPTDANSGTTFDDLSIG